MSVQRYIISLFHAIRQNWLLTVVAYDSGQELTCLLEEGLLLGAAVGDVLEGFHGAGHLTHFNKGVDDGDGGLGSTGRLQNGGEHVKASLGEGFRSITSFTTNCFAVEIFVRKIIIFCSYSFNFLCFSFRKFKDITFRKLIIVSSRVYDRAMSLC